MAVKHIHKLKKHKYKTGIAVFFCTLDCSFKIEVPFALGKEALCNICGQAFTMNEYALKLTRPHCSKCGRKEVKDIDGKKHYISKVNNDQIISDIAANETSSLKDRLSKLTQTTQIEDDI
jgi:hypothetical protein